MFEETIQTRKEFEPAAMMVCLGFLLFFPLKVLLIGPLVLLGSGIAAVLGFYENGGHGQGVESFLLGLLTALVSTVLIDGFRYIRYRSLT